MGFVGFYDAKPNDTEKIYIGEYVSNADIVPCGEIRWGKGQCGECAEKRITLIAEDTKKLENYIACDDETRSEIVIPCFEEAMMHNTHKDGKGPFKTQLDIDGPDVGNFDKEDQKYLEKLLVMIYPGNKIDSEEQEEVKEPAAKKQKLNSGM